MFSKSGLFFQVHLFIFSFIYWGGGMNISQLEGVGQRTNYGSWFSLIMWVLGIRFRASGLVTRVLAS